MGEVPTSVRSTFMQKSRWCKGGMQIFFSHHNALLASNLTFMQKLIWNTSGWAYICTTVTTPVFQARCGLGTSRACCRHMDWAARMRSVCM